LAFVDHCKIILDEISSLIICSFDVIKGSIDFFVGGAANFSGKLFTQNTNIFRSGNLVDNTGKPGEDMDCLLFDADNDKDLDLLVTYGDSQPYNSEWRSR